MSRLFGELKRRNVFRMAIAYAVSAWLIIQVAETIFPLFGFDDSPARIVVILLAIGFPITLILSWVYEFTPDGVQLERDIDRSTSITHPTDRSLDRAIIVILTLAVAYFLIDKFVFDPARDAALTESVTARVRDEIATEPFGDKSIAVLPFANMSDDEANEYFSDGISEEILNLLARIPDLRVISRSSAFAFKGKEISIPQVAEQLNVAHVLEGSVRKSGNSVRITAQLIDAGSDAHLWSETYDRELNDIFAIQDEIAAAVVDKLKLTLLDGVPVSQPIDTEAYSLYLRAEYLRRLLSADSLNEAEELYKQSLDLQPDYVPSWIGLSAVYDNQIINGTLGQEEGYALEQQAIDRALEIDPESASALDSLSWLADKRDNDLAQSAAYSRRSLELAPNDINVLGNAARVLTSLGRLEEATAIRRYAIARDPLNPLQHNNLGALNIYKRKYEEARGNMNRVLELSPDFFGIQYLVGLTELLSGDPSAALNRFNNESDDVWRLKGQAMANHSLQRFEAANEALVALIEAGGEDWPTEVAQVYAHWNDSDSAFEWLARDTDPGGWAEARQLPVFDSLRHDLRWQELMESYGVSDEQLAAIDFSVDLPVDGV